MPHESGQPASDRLLIHLARTKLLEPFALRALLKATHLLGLVLGTRLTEMRAAGVPTLTLQSKAEEAGLHAAAFAEISEILAARWGKVPDRHRPFYTSEQRYRILRLKQLLGMTQEETARRFVVSPETIARWEPISLAGRVLQAKYPNHIWMADVTEILGLFRLFTFKLAVVFDVFSRMPLAASVQPGKPTAKQMVRLLRRAATVTGWPRHFASDHDRAFTAIRFRRFLKRHRIRQRFGAIGKAGSIALLERLWKTLKGKLAVKLFPPVVLKDARRRVDLGLVHYAFFRPHQGLDGATPAEIYFRLEPAHLSAKPPPRGEPGRTVDAPVFEIVLLDPERRLPVLLRKAA